MYLEQELESLKAVLEIKNEKLHQQDIKLLKMEKLVRLDAVAFQNHEFVLVMQKQALWP